MATLLRLKPTLAKCGRGRTAFYDDIGKGLFVKPIRAGERASAWPAHEVDAIIAARIRGASPEAIKQLVTKLHTDRQTFEA